MPVDRGGLRYGIEVENKFSGPLKDFRNGLRAAKREFRDFKNNIRGLGGEAQGVKRAFRDMGRSARQSRREIRESRREMGKMLSRSQQLQAETRRQNREQDKVRQFARRANSQLRAQRTRINELTQAYNRLRVAQNRTGNAPTPGGGGRRPRAPGGGGRGPGVPNQTPGFFRSLTAALDGSNEAGTRVLFTFRRLFGILALFTLAREALNVIQSIIGTMVGLNSELEQTRLGVASLILGTGRVSDGFGNMLKGSEALNVSLNLSEDQMRKLRVDALKTSATFSELSNAYQLALGPGLAANLDLDQIRKLTVRISQAAATQGLKQNELAEEIRSLFTGTAQGRTTRLANIFGVSPAQLNAEIRAARESGELFEVLSEKFSAFEEAEGRALETFSVRLANARGAIEEVLRLAGEPLTKSLKDVFLDIRNSVVDMEDAGKNGFGLTSGGVKAVEVIQRLAAGLRTAVEEAGRLLSVFRPEDFEQTATLIGEIGSGFSRFVSQFIEGFLRGLEDAATIMRLLASEFSKLTGLDLVGDGTIRSLARVLALAISLKVAFFAVGGVLTSVVIPAMATLVTRTWSFATAILSAAGPLPIMVITVAALGALLVHVARQARNLAIAITGVDLNWGQMFALAANQVSGVLQKLLVRIILFADQAKLYLQKAGLFFYAVFARPIDSLKIQLRRFLAFILQSFRDALSSVPGFVQRAAGILPQAQEAALSGIVEAQNKIEESIKEAVARRAEETVAIRTQNKAIDDQLTLLRLARDNALIQVDQEVAAEGTKIAAQPDQFGFSFTGVTQEIEQGLTNLRDYAKASFDIAEPFQQLQEEVKNANDQLTAAEPESFWERFQRSAKEAFDALPDIAEVAVGLVKGVVQQFGNFVADVIVDAFDPNNDKSLKERFFDFLRALAKQVIATLVTIAVTKLVLKAISAASGGAVTDLAGAEAQAVGGFRKGGKVHNPWAKARGFAGGGIPSRPATGVSRPKGIDPRDTVPIWTQPGEWVIRKSSVAKYGNETMSAINQGLIDPMGLKALAGIRRSNVTRTQRGPGFAAGGEVPPEASTLQANAPASREQGPGVAVMVADDRQMERLLRGGGRQMMRWMRDNQSEIRRTLGG